MAAVIKGGRRKKPMAEINVVPYIDVMLVLLVIFMVTAPMLTQGVKVELPKAAAKPVDAKKDVINVGVKKDGSYWLDVGKESAEAGGTQMPLADIKQKVGILLNADPTTPVLVKGDRAVEYGVVVTLMAELQQAGAKSVGLVTDPNSR
ncbi:MAG: protein TolR [Chitinophagaceae bacterium]|jgi:biopolymer transport protein TolR|nr:MAG: protein TolR [Chitinophagaceae bacterium]